MIFRALYGSLMGGAIGDSYGLPFEGLPPKRTAKVFNFDNKYHLIPIINGAMVSDDTEHAVMTVQAYIASGGDIDGFRKALKWRLVLWLFGLPAGVGLATGRSIFKMMMGLKNTGVYSAGNGGAMRSAVLGVLCDELDELKKFVYQSTILTHSDPKAYQGSLVIALLAWIECRHSEWTTTHALNFLKSHINDTTLLELIDTHTVHKKGITGYIYDTIPAVVQAWIAFRSEPLVGLNHLVRQGGDSDSTCAIFGGIVGVRFGSIMQDSVAGVWCEPRLRPVWLSRLAHQAAEVFEQKTAQKPLALFGIWTYPRNLIFLMIVLLHGFRRLLPPY